MHGSRPSHLEIAVARAKRAVLKAVAYSVFTITTVIAAIVRCVRQAGV